MNRGGSGLWIAWLSVAGALGVAVVGLAMGLSPSPGLCDRLRDDAFYEFTWAANVAAGRGPVVSDGTATSGVQLLWSLLLVPVSWLFGAASLPTVAPWLGFVLHVAGAWVWWFACRDRITAACVSLCWLGNPLLVRECQNGQETALAVFVLAVLWHCRYAREPRFALLAVLAVLARTELFAVVAALSWLRHPRAIWRAFCVPALVLAVALSVNRLLGGGWLPDSATPMAWLWHANFAATMPDTAQYFAKVWWFLRPVLLGGPFALASAFGLGVAVFALVRPWWPARLRAAPALAVGCAAAFGMHDLATPGWAALLLALWPARVAHRVPRELLALSAGTAAIIALHWAVRWYPRDYYAAPLVVVALVAVERHGHGRAVLCAMAMAQLVDIWRFPSEPLRGQQEMHMGGRFLAEVVPPGERVGCFNSGIVTFESTVLRAGTPQQRAVVNLDGVVDSRSLLALRHRQLDAWLDAQQLRFLIDNPVQFADDPVLPHAVGRWFGENFQATRDLVEIARFDVPGVDNGRPAGDSFRLYWRVRRGEMPEKPTQPRDLGPAAAGGRYVLWPATAGGSLEAEQTDGRREPLLDVDVATTVFVLVPARHLGTGRLFERGRAEPVLVFPGS